MKRLLVVATLASVMVGCSSPESGIRLLNAHPFDGDCEVDNDHFISRGSLDLSATGTYNLAFNVASDLIGNEVTVGGDTLQGEAQNTFYVEQVLYRYSSVPSLAFQEERLNALFAVPPGAADDSYMALDLIQSQALEVLRANVPAGEEVELLVTIRLEGKFAGGKKSHTNDVSFPVRIYNSGFAGCAASDRVAPTGPCGNAGQDSAIGCCTNPAFADLCS